MTTRADVIADASLVGADACIALSDVTDAWLAELFAAATSGEKKSDDMVLIAVGGYGRRELAPHSDLDVLLIHKSVKNIADVASKIWYPVWDAGIKLGHAVRTPKEAIKLCETDLDTATALVTSRIIAGNMKLGNEVIREASEGWTKHGREWLVQLHGRILDRYAKDGEVAFLLEPNLKEGLGGLRDIHALHWAVKAGLDLSAADKAELTRCNNTLLRVRVALHRHIGRASEILRLEDQAPVAKLAGYESDDDLMAAVAEVGRKVAWIADEAWARLDPPAQRSATPQPLAPGVQLINGEVHLDDAVNIADDPTLLLRVATAAARHGVRIDRASLDRLGELSPQWPDPWPAGASDSLVNQRFRFSSPSINAIFLYESCQSGHPCAASHSEMHSTATRWTDICGKQSPMPPALFIASNARIFLFSEHSFMIWARDTRAITRKSAFSCSKPSARAWGSAKSINTSSVF